VARSSSIHNQRKCRFAQRAQSERGSTLILALVLIIVVAVAGAAVLNQESSSGNVQAAYGKVRNLEFGFDGNIDAITQSMRSNLAAGTAGDLGGLCSNSSTGTSTGQWTDPASNVKYDVLCKPDSNSGHRIGASANGVPDASIITLGGMVKPGNYSGTAQTNPNAWLPFCDDYHDFQDTGSVDRCESGLFVGQLDSTNDNASGGLYVASNGTVATGPLVRSNGSIIVSNVTGYQRRLDVDGSISSRRYCGTGAGWNSPGFFANVNANNGGTRSCCQTRSIAQLLPTDCAPPPATVGDFTGETASSNTLYADPDYVHEPFDPKKMQKVDDSQLSSAYKLDPATLCASSNNGFVVMPAGRLTDPSSNPVWYPVTINGVTTNYPVYGAWYDDANDLRTLMKDSRCDGSLFWFRPGIYYFDFLDTQTHDGVTKTSWTGPDGCFPITNTCARRPSELFGGMPVFDSSGGAYGSNFCLAGLTDYTQAGINANVASAAGCQQPARIMQPQKNTAQNANDWADDTQVGTQYVVPSAMAIEGTPSDPTTVATANLSGNYQESQLITSALQTPMPENAGTTVQSLKLEVPYDLINSPYAQSHGQPSFTDLSNQWSYNPNLGPGADLKISIGATGALCYLHLYPGMYNTTNIGADGRPHANVPLNLSTGIGNVFDLKNGCDASVLGDQVIEQVSGGANPFPTGTGSALHPGNGFKLKDHPDWVNTLAVTLDVRVPTTVLDTSPSIVHVDGIQFAVQWKGRPALVFPGACQDTLPGAQLVFGNTARIAWGQDGDAMFGEFCASSQEQFPNWNGDPECTGAVGAPCMMTGPGHGYAIAVYGMSEDSAGPPAAASTDPSASTVLTIKPDDANTVKFAHPPWNSGTKPVASDYNTISDSASAIASWTDRNDAVLQFTLPSATDPTPLVCGNITGSNLATTLLATPMNCDLAKQIPYGSQILSLKLTLNHREGHYGGPGLTNLVYGEGITKVKVKIQPGTPGTGSNGSSSTTWASDSTNHNGFVQSNGTDGIPVCTTSTYCPTQWGDLTDTGYPSTATAFPDWSVRRNITDPATGIHSPEGLQGATITATISPFDYGNGTYHYAEIDGVKLTVKYRPPTAPRPLGGCATVRIGNFPSTVANTRLQPSDFEGAGPGHDWLDWDWGLIYSTKTDPEQSGDQAFGNFSGSAGGNNIQDHNDCPVIGVYSPNGNNPVKFHVDGVIYTPSGAVELAGNDNDSAWATGGVVVRHLTALRWKSGGDIPAIGGSTLQYYPRTVTITICDLNSSCSTGHVRVRAQVEFIDGDHRPSQIGSQVKVLSWIRNPPT
jgi:hypothetical protein